MSDERQMPLEKPAEPALAPPAQDASEKETW